VSRHITPVHLYQAYQPQTSLRHRARDQDPSSLTGHLGHYSIPQTDTAHTQTDI